MKKTIAAVAVLSAFAGSALAADISLYGRIDSGMVYTHTQNVADKDGLSMESGWVTGSRWGIKGTEDLGNMKVGFVLESGFSHDSGLSGQDGRLFGREAVVTVEGGFGKAYMGRIGSIVSDSGSISLLGNASVFGNAYGTASMIYTTGAAMTRYDNVLAYVSPKFAGLDVRAMFSSKGDSRTNFVKDGVAVKDADVGDEFSGYADRYAAVGLNYGAGPLTLVATADLVMYGNDTAGNADDGINIVIGGNYKLDCATVYGKVAYFDNVQMKSKLTTDGYEKGYGLELGAKVPALGGDVLASIGYRSAEEAAKGKAEYDLYSFNLGYNYAFSKRTSVYGAVGYHVEEDNAAEKNEVKAYQVGVGLIHKF